MPVGAYFKGKGAEVMGAMQRRYGAKKGKSVFYATANKKGQNPDGEKNPAKEAAMKRRLKKR